MVHCCGFLTRPLSRAPWFCRVCLFRYRQKNAFQFDMDMPSRTVRDHPSELTQGTPLASLDVCATLPDDIEVCRFLALSVVMLPCPLVLVSHRHACPPPVVPHSFFFCLFLRLQCGVADRLPRPSPGRVTVCDRRPERQLTNLRASAHFHTPTPPTPGPQATELQSLSLTASHTAPPQPQSVEESW